MDETDDEIYSKVLTRRSLHWMRLRYDVDVSLWQYEAQYIRWIP